MSEALIANLRTQLGGPRDGAMLRYSLGNALLSSGDAVQAVLQLREALTFDPEYSAAWRRSGKRNSRPVTSLRRRKPGAKGSA